jgi:ABC-type transport system involved in cytochrome bd biosynthesis fused ATPase/permease subunit
VRRLLPASVAFFAKASACSANCTVVLQVGHGASPSTDRLEIEDSRWAACERAHQSNPAMPPGGRDLHGFPSFQVVVVGTTGSGKSSLLASMLSATQQVYGPAPIM